MTWSGDLHKFFLDRNYYFIPSLYGSAFSNYMGIAIAFPLARYRLVDVETRCVAESKKLNKAPASLFKTLPRLLWTGAFTLLRRAWQLVSRGMQMLGLLRSPHPFITDQDKCCWEVSLNRRNTLIFLRLQEKEAGPTPPRSFCVATYHMPCVFWDERVMVSP
jgi:hypothetical protein